MTDESYTRCPGCRTVFRVTPQQLALRGGQVRCGHCRAVFDGHAQAISLAPAPDSEHDALALGPPTVTLRSARALEPPHPSHAAAPSREPSFGAESRPQSKLAEDAARREQRERRERLLYAAALPLLLILLAGQALFHYRDALAARWPGTKPALTRMCAVAGCSIQPMQEAGGLSIYGSELQEDPAHRGLLTLTATIRNRSAIALAYPHIELTLNDVGDRVVVRRALAPADYAGGTADVANGIPPNGEAAVKLFIDASAIPRAGFRLYLFYP